MKIYLLVEGLDEEFVVKHIFLRRHNKDIDPKIIINCKGYTNLLPKIETLYKTSDVLGIIIDANASLKSRWQQLKDYFLKVNVALPEYPDGNGVYFIDDKGKKIGIWIMPNNSKDGYLENFLLDAIDPNDNLIHLSHKIVNEIIENKLQRFKDNYKTKSIIHTWLAWQEEPGYPFGLSIKSKYFNINSESYNLFAVWLDKLLEINTDLL